ncbi:MAG: 50S ribosomal protein L10 [Cyanobacteriota bacterium]|nr:50S ribosomal protein L10 [Cyanobacteriota bacterium]
MGKQPLTKKIEVVDEVRALLDSSQMVVVIDYKGLTVSEMNQLRADLRAFNSVCMVVKNTLMRRAIEDRPAWAGLPTFLKGSTAFILVRGDIAATLKAYQDFQKKVKKSEFQGAAIEGLALNLDQAKAIADLPPKEVLMAQVAGGINSLATKLAVSLNAVPTQVVRVINEVPASVGRVIQAIADKDAA